MLAYWGGYTQRQIAQHTGVPLGTVKTRMLGAMRRLQQALPSADAAPVIPAQAGPRSSVDARGPIRARGCR